MTISHGTILEGKVAGEDYIPIPGETLYEIGEVDGEPVYVTLARFTQETKERAIILSDRMAVTRARILALGKDEPHDDLAASLKADSQELFRTIGKGEWPDEKYVIEEVACALIRDFFFVLMQTIPKQETSSTASPDSQRTQAEGEPATKNGPKTGEERVASGTSPVV